jgi:hypothetical protein
VSVIKGINYRTGLKLHMNIASYIGVSVLLFQTKASTCLVHDLQNDQLLFCSIIEIKGMGPSLLYLANLSRH